MDTAHTVTVPVTALHLLENQIKMVKENLIRKQESLMQVGELQGILKKCDPCSIFVIKSVRNGTSTSNPFLCAADFFLQLGSYKEAVR